MIEHRKFGVGIFVQDKEDLLEAKQIANLINKGVQCAQPFYVWKATEAVAASKFNVINNCEELQSRFNFLKETYQNKTLESNVRKEEFVETTTGNGRTLFWPSVRLKKEANWLGIAAIDAFFSWTEHLFVHFAILNGKVKTGEAFSKISGENWDLKFKSALDLSIQSMKLHYDKLIELRRQVRNFIAHGAFGRDGKTLLFHSKAGAVPVFQDFNKKQPNFTLGSNLSIDSTAALLLIESFITELKVGINEPIWMYAQEYGLPTIMTMALDGTYDTAIKSATSMKIFADHLSAQIDNASNMDW